MAGNTTIELRRNPLRDMPADAGLVLLVGESEDGVDERGDGGVIHVALGKISAELLDRLKPVLILSPLISRSFDCSDLALILHGHGYRGSYRAVTAGLPRPEVIRREIRSLCPELKFDLTVVGG